MNKILVTFPWTWQKLLEHGKTSFNHLFKIKIQQKTAINSAKFTMCKQKWYATEKFSRIFYALQSISKKSFSSFSSFPGGKSKGWISIIDILFFYVLSFFFSKKYSYIFFCESSQSIYFCLFNSIFDICLKEYWNWNILKWKFLLRILIEQFRRVVLFVSVVLSNLKFKLQKQCNWDVLKIGVVKNYAMSCRIWWLYRQLFDGKPLKILWKSKFYVT